MNGGAQLYKHQAIDANGNPYPLAVMYHYVAGGTTTAKTIWTDEAKTTPAAQPLVADSKGFFSFYADGDYRLLFKNAAETVTIDDLDPVRITKDSTGIWEGDHGTAYPAANANSVGHLFTKIVSNVCRGLGINADGASYDELFAFDADGIFQIEKILLKQPFTNIRAFGAKTKVEEPAIDYSTEIQNAYDYAETDSGIVLIPFGMYRCKNIDVPAGVKTLGIGHASGLELFDAIAADNYILKSTDEHDFEVAGVFFDGAGLGNSNKLIWVSNTTGTHVHVRITGCHFEDQAASGIAIYIAGSSGTQMVGEVTINGDCHIHNGDKGIVTSYADYVNIHSVYISDMTSIPVHLQNSDKCSVESNVIHDWGASDPGVKLDDCDECLVGKNQLYGTEAKSIETTGTSNYNLIDGNNVRGGHANDIISAGTNDVVVHNIGSSIFKGGQGETGGVATEDDWDFVKYTGTTEDDGGTLTGYIYDSTVQFTDTALAVDDPGSLFDHIRLPGLTNDENMFFSVRDITTAVDEHKLTLGNSDVFDTTLAIAASLGFSGYPNFMDTASGRGWDWEDTAFAEFDLDPTNGTPNVNTSVTLYGEKGLIRAEVWRDSGSQDGYVQLETTGYSKKNVTGTVSSSGSTQISNSFFFKPSGVHTVTGYGTWTGPGVGTAAFKVKLYRLKRDVDLTG